MVANDLADISRLVCLCRTNVRPRKWAPQPLHRDDARRQRCYEYHDCIASNPFAHAHGTGCVHSSQAAAVLAQVDPEHGGKASSSSVLSSSSDTIIASEHKRRAIPQKPPPLSKDSICGSPSSRSTEGSGQWHGCAGRSASREAGSMLAHQSAIATCQGRRSDRCPG